MSAVGTGQMTDVCRAETGQMSAVETFTIKDNQRRSQAKTFTNKDCSLKTFAQLPKDLTNALKTHAAQYAHHNIFYILAANIRLCMSLLLCPLLFDCIFKRNANLVSKATY